MKRIYLWAILTLCVACVPETPQADTAAIKIQPAARLLSVQPGNPQNTFDAAGQLHNIITDAWLLKERIPGHLEEALKDVEEMAEQEELFHQLKGDNYIAPHPSQLSSIMAQPETRIDLTIASAGMSLAAGKSLESFIQKIMELDAADVQYEDIYSYCVIYEADIMRQEFTEKDRDIILLTASIARHASHLAKTRKRKPRDRDWDLVIVNIAAAIEGAKQGTAQATILAATAGILSNYKDEGL